jgi:hypothetical protein
MLNDSFKSSVRIFLPEASVARHYPSGQRVDPVVSLLPEPARQACLKRAKVLQSIGAIVTWLFIFMLIVGLKNRFSKG